MKIFSVDQVRELDAFTIQHEPISSIDLMERASKAFVERFKEKFDSTKSVLICCGTGNNGGDGLAVARLLHADNYDVSVLVIGDANSGSDDFKTNLSRLSIPTENFIENKELPESDIIIDAIFGSGLSRPAEGQYADLIKAINRSSARIVSIDIPSGLFADKITDSKNIVEAEFTLSFQLPKLVFMLPDTHQYVGDWEILDIGLSNKFIADQETSNHFTTLSDVGSLLKHTSKFDHKGTNGHALLIAGSFGKMGAAVLASRACLRMGVGLLSVHVPKCGNDILQSTVPEAMTIPDKEDRLISEYPDVSNHSAIGIGPGIGKNKETVEALENLISADATSLVLDADAINILSENRQLIELIPENTILTPHPKEFERLIGQPWNSDFEKLELQRKWAKELNCIVIVKGAHTSVALPNGDVHFNSTGNPGMAKGGSGDVLTGIITSLLAQHYEPSYAAIFGVFLHGLAGDMAAKKKGEIAMIAGDIIETIPEAYYQILSNC